MTEDKKKFPKRAVKTIVERTVPDASFTKEAWPAIWAKAEEYIARIAKDAYESAQNRNRKRVTPEDIDAAAAGELGSGQGDSEESSDEEESDDSPSASEEEYSKEEKVDYVRYMKTMLARANMEIRRLGGKPILLATPQQVKEGKRFSEQQKRRKKVVSANQND